MQTLGMDHVTFLEERPVSLTSEYADGKILSVDTTGHISFQYPSTSFDQRWKFLKTPQDDVVLSSEQLGLMVCHNFEDGCDVHTRKLNSFTEGCEWKLGKKGELYMKDPFDGEKYLWVANDNLHVTSDGYIAERWLPLTYIHRPNYIEFGLWHVILALMMLFLVAKYMKWFC